MSNFPQISRMQYFYIFAIANICFTPFSFPTALFKQLEHHAWISPLAAFALTAWNLLVAIGLARLYPDQNIVEWSRGVLGRWVGGLFSLCVILILYFWGIGMVWSFMLLIKFTQLTYTPTAFPTLLLVGGVVYLLYQGLESFARFAELLVMILFAALIAINVVQFYNADFSRLLPVGNLPLEKLLHPDVISSLFVFRGIFIVYFLFKYLNKTKRLLPLSILSLSIAFVEILFAVILPISIYGALAAKKFTYPYQESLSSVTVTWLPIEKLTFLTPILWQLIIAYVLASSLFCATEGVASLFHIKNKRRLLIIVGIITWLIVMNQVPQIQLNRMITVWSIAGLLIFTVIPTLLWAILSVRRLLKT